MMKSPRQKVRFRSLSGKLLLPIVGLMLISLLGSTLAFVGGTAFTRDQLLKQQIGIEAERVSMALANRVEAVANAANLLAHDPTVMEAVAGQYDESAVKTINNRAVVIRDRFGADLVQIYDADGQAWANLVISSLYRESSLLEQVALGQPQVHVVDGRPLLLSLIEMPEGVGSVITGIDLETELQRLVSRYRLASELGLTVEGHLVGTRQDLPFDVDGQHRGQYVHHLSLTLGESRLDLVLVRSTADVTQVTNTGLMIMVGSTLLTMLLLVGLSVIITRAIAQPVRRLSTAAEAVARGDLDQQVTFDDHKRRFGIGDRDEIGLLANGFNSMVAELRGLYDNLEAKVQARTRELVTAAEMARMVSSSLNQDLVLRRSVELIYDRLRFYHIGIFVLEPGSNMAVLCAAIGEGGRLFEGKDFKLAVGSKSLVGAAAARKEPCISQDVRTEPIFWGNERLPDTASEAAFPLLIGETVLGVLDVQSRQIGAFDSATVGFLAALADQIATGVYNAQLYAQQCKAAEHLAQVDRLKSQFLATVSHEVRTPLNSIIGFSKMLLNGMTGPLSDEQKEDVAIIHESGQHLLVLINDVLDISKINAGEMRLSLEEIYLPDAIDSALVTITGLLGDKPVDLVQEVEPDLPLVYADVQRVHQILLNLLSNAAKFTDTGRITVRARPIEALNPQSHEIEPYVETSVSDTGIGIPQEKLGEIFQEFVQADNAGSRRYQGTGLGLSITKKLVEMQAGRIWVESRVGRGSTFTFILPQVRSDLAAIPPVFHDAFGKETDYVT